MKLIASKIVAIKADESFENPLNVFDAEQEIKRVGLLYAIANVTLVIVVVIGVLFNLLAAWADISLPGAA